MLCSEQSHVYESAIQKDLIEDVDTYSKMTTKAFFVRVKIRNEMRFVSRDGAGL